MVAGHAVLTSRTLDVHDEQAWWLHDYQKGQVTLSCHVMSWNCHVMSAAMSCHQ